MMSKATGEKKGAPMGGVSCEKPQEAPVAKEPSWHRLGWLLVPTIGVLCLAPVMSRDVWWHMAYGRTLWEQGVLSGYDLYSWTHKGEPIGHVPWLTGLVFYWLWALGGIPALVLLKGVVGSLWAGFTLYRLRQKGVRWFWVLLVVGLCGLLIFPRLSLLRSFYALFLLLPLLQLLWDHYGPELSWRWTWCFPLIFLVWVNAHASFPLGLFWLGVTLFWPLLWDRKHLRRNLLALFSLLFLCAGAICLNPTHYRTWLMIFQMMTQTQPNQNILFTAETMPLHASLFYYTPHGLALALLLLCLPPLLFLSWRRYGAEKFFWLGILYFFFRSQRFIGIFAVTTALLLPGWLETLHREWEEQPQSRRARWSRGIFFLSFVVLVGWGVWYTFAGRVPLLPPRLSLSLKSEEFPVASARYLNHYRPQGRLYNVVGPGGFLIWEVPSIPVSIDGRLNVFYKDSFWREQVGQFLQGSQDFKKLLRKMKVDIALLPYGTLVRQLSTSPRWLPVCYDREYILYLRRGGPNEVLLQKTGYWHLRLDRLATQPKLLQQWTRWRFSSPQAFRKLRQELRRALKEFSPAPPPPLLQLRRWLQQQASSQST